MLAEFLDRIVRLARPPVSVPVFAPAAGGVHVAAVQEGYTLERMPSPGKVHPVRRHTFGDIDSFSAFLLRHTNSKAVEILASPAKVTALSSVDWTRDELTCTLDTAPAFAAWCRVFGAKLDQRATYKALNARREELVEAGAMLSAFRTLEIHGKTEAKMALTGSGAVEFSATSQAGQVVTGKIPDAFTVRVPVYRGGPTFDLDVLVEFEFGPPASFVLVARNLDTVKEIAFEAEMARLRQLLGGEEGGYLVSRGVAAVAE